MKILFFTRRFYPDIGGVEKHGQEIAKRLILKGHDLIVITESPGEECSPIEEKEGIKIYRISVFGREKLKKFQIWRWLWQHRDVIKEADIVHCHDVFFWYLPWRFIWPRKKVFVTFHGWEGHFPPRVEAKAVRKLSEKLSWGNICVGDYIRRWYRTKPDLVTYGGVNPLFERKLRFRSSGRKIVFVGRLSEDTGLPIYLKALRQLNKKVAFEVIFLGDGPLKARAQKMGKVLGFVNNPEKYLAESKVVFASGYLSILEAMVLKKPVVCVYDNPLKEDYLRLPPFARWAIIEADPKVLVDRVISLLKEGPEKIKINQAYDWAKKQTWEKLAEEYLKLWQKN